ncbi:MAG TPA: hypothetical protein VIG24_08950 [Acidimicrobiia bacterium]
MRQITILDVLTEEGYQKFKDKGVGEKLSGTSFRADEPANNLFWGMFRQIGRMAKDADQKDQEHSDVVTGMANELAVAEDQIKMLQVYCEIRDTEVGKMADRIRSLEKTIVGLAVERTFSNARLEALGDEL